MVAAVSVTPNPKASSNRSNLPGRRPLLPSEVDNGVVAAPWRPKSREVTSRYLSSSTSTTSGSSSSSWSSSFSSSSTSRRCASPLARTSSSSGVMTPMPNSSSVKRSQSVERRRPATPRPNGGEMPNAAKMLFNSTRSLSVSFQGESFALPVSKAKPSAAACTPNLSNVRKGTPERRKAMTPLRNGADQTENSKPIEQHRWPARSRQVNSLTRSLDMTAERKKLYGSGSVVRALQHSMIDEKSRGSNSINSAVEKPAPFVLVDAKLVKGSDARSDNVAGDTESVSSCSVSGGHECVTNSLVQARGGVRGIVVPARFWQETNNRVRYVSEPGSPQKGSMSKTMAPPLKQILPRNAVLDSPSSSSRGISSNRGFVSPLRAVSRPASPSRLATPNLSSPSYGMSHSRGRNAVASVRSTPTILNFGADVRRGRLGEDKVADVHLLRILHNRYLQWRFINAKSDATLRAQKLSVEKNLYDAWDSISKLQHSVRDKRNELQLMKQNLKASSILTEQMKYLEEWAQMDQDHSISLSGLSEALKANTLRLPLVGGARADVQQLKDAVCSAVDVMQAMASSICFLLPKVEDVNSLTGELASIISNERGLLCECKDFLSTVAAMQVKDCSLRAHMLQLNHASSI